MEPLVDGDLLLLASGFVLGRDIQDTVGIDVEAHNYLWNAFGCWRNGELKLAQQVIVASLGPFTLVNLDTDTRLVVIVGRYDYLLLGGDRSVTLMKYTLSPLPLKDTC